MTNYAVKKGEPAPLGAEVKEGGINFAIFSKHAESITLHLIDPVTKNDLQVIEMVSRAGDIWHVFVVGVLLPVLYAYRVHGSRDAPFFFDPKHLLSDPYATVLSTTTRWGDSYPYPNGAILPKGDFDWEGVEKPNHPLKDLIIYEMHVRGFTQDPSSGVSHPGTFLGVIEKIPYLKELGVNAVELLPVHEFNESEYQKLNPLTKERLFNFWGYSTVNFFSPMNRYAVSEELGASVREFKQMVRELHRAGIEVILDVVFNHTAEIKKTTATYSFMGIDRTTYYLLDGQGKDRNFTGCGNTMNLNHPVMRLFVSDCLIYWTREMQVDGFRFDLASIMNRNRFGDPVQNAPLIELLTFEPQLADAKLIAEPWDSGGLYQIGGFAPDDKRWGEWNGKFRDAVRSFIKGDPHSKNEFAERLCGSQDLFGMRDPQASINFITAHDGFSLCDLVSYNQKHNMANGEGNRDGNSYNISWNCGAEGETEDPDIRKLRLRQMKNFFVALFLSQGVPMMLMGDEQAHTRRGNNNPWCQDNDLNWMTWDKKNPELFAFVKKLIEFRKTQPILKKEAFLNEQDITWHGLTPGNPDWENEKPFIAFTLENKIYAAFNAIDETVLVTLPPMPQGKKWSVFLETSKEGVFDGNTLKLPHHSSAVLILL